MREEYNGTYLYDGMFVVYNKTKDLFEDARTYNLLKNIETYYTDPQENTEVILSINKAKTVTYLNIHHNRNPTSCIKKATWSDESGTFYGSNSQVNTWVKNAINAAWVNQADEDIIFTQMIPSDFYSTQKIKDNWNNFVEEYKTMEDDDTGKLITLPRFVLITANTHMKLNEINEKISPNVIIDTDELINPFEEKDWNWIRIGENVILRNVKPVPRGDLIPEESQHRGIYCGLWVGGRVHCGDDVLICPFNLSPKKKLNLPRI